MGIHGLPKRKREVLCTDWGGILCANDNNVERFLEEFQESKSCKDVLSGTYWFAFILYRRFIHEHAQIVCDLSTQRFAVKIHGKIYDVTGNVTDKGEWVAWVDIDYERFKQIESGIMR